MDKGLSASLGFVFGAHCPHYMCMPASRCTEEFSRLAHNIFNEHVA
jgi:hypothetical protein